ncbi:hypothetical protein HQ487_00900 [Candidatus Uhrbacteria bacterium]|nr:hypothetical protein [Candidatus Uhrbacteria bacterium]
MGSLSNEDLRVIKFLREQGVLENDDAGKLESPDGVIVIPCSDGDQMPDVFTHQCQLAYDGGWPVRPHMPSLHGGAMLIAEECPLYRDPHGGELLLQHIREAEGPDLKGIGTVVLYVHAPCGAAGLANLTIIHQIVYLMRAKERVKAIDTTNKVCCFIHVDYGVDEGLLAQVDDPVRLGSEKRIRQLAKELGVRIEVPPFDTHRRRTYFISYAKWVAFWASHGRKFWRHLFNEDPYPDVSSPRAQMVLRNPMPSVASPGGDQPLAPVVKTPLDMNPLTSFFSNKGLSDTLLAIGGEDED